MKMNLDAIRNGISMPNLLAQLPKIPVASAVSGLIVAALILMTPNPWFEAFIVETGLPGLVAAAEPPLGARARIVFALIAALIVTIAAWAVLTAILGRKLSKRSEEHYGDDRAVETQESPRIRRRADSHPDAPYRRPIMAGDEMGVPLDLVTVAPEEPADRNDDILELDEIVEEDPTFVEAIDTIAETSADDDQPVLPETDATDEMNDRPEPVFAISLPQRDAVSNDPVPEPVEREEVAVAPIAPAPHSDARAELADLVARLEAGLERKQGRRKKGQNGPADQAHENVTAHPQAQPQSQSRADQDAALREALSALQSVAGKAS